MKFRYNTSFILDYNPKDIDPSYKMDLDFWDCFGRKKALFYNWRNAVFVLKIVIEGCKLLVLFSQILFYSDTTANS